MTVHSQLKLAVQAHQQGQSEKARIIYQQILKENPRQAEALHYLGLLNAQDGQIKSGIELMLRALKIQPQNVSFLNNLGNLYRDLGQYQAALTCFSEILKRQASDAEVLSNRALVWLALGEPGKAQKDLQQAIFVRPQDALLWFNLGRSHQQENNYKALKEARTYYLKALEINPKLAKAWNSLGNICLEQNTPEEAVAFFEKALKSQPDWPEPLINLASAYAEQSKSEEALQILEQFLAVSPEHHTARLNYAQLLLLKGRLKEGFSEYEASRWRLERKIRPLGNLDLPLWQGENTSSLLLSCEQGFGDSLQFIRFLPQVQQRVSETWLECPPQLTRFFESIPGLKVLTEGSELPEVQAWAPLLRLPFVLGTDLESIPNQTPYLEAHRQSFPQVFHKLLAESHKGVQKSLKIGVVWGTGYHKDPTYFKLYQRKSASPEDFEALSRLFPQHVFFSLQVGRDAVDLPHVHNLGPHIQDFSDTAGFIQHLDLVISTDTAVAHLAGALAKPVWLLLPKVADWRWLEDCEESPWYPEMRLFRQSQAGVWTDLFLRVGAALEREFVHHDP